MLLFSWPPAREVWPNYEVGMFQPWSGTDPSLGSVANVTSYLYPSHCFNCFLDLYPSPSVYRLPPHPPPLYWAAPLFAPISSPSYDLGTPVYMYERPLPPASTTHPCARCLAALGLLPRSLSTPSPPLRDPVSCASSPVHSPQLSLPSTLLASLSTPVGSLFFISSFLRHSSDHSSPLTASTWGPVPASP